MASKLCALKFCACFSLLFCSFHSPYICTTSCQINPTSNRSCAGRSNLHNFIWWPQTEQGLFPLCRWETEARDRCLSCLLHWTQVVLRLFLRGSLYAGWWEIAGTLSGPGSSRSSWPFSPHIYPGLSPGGCSPPQCFPCSVTFTSIFKSVFLRTLVPQGVTRFS